MNWLKIHQFFERLLNTIKDVNTMNNMLGHIQDLLQRSVQSERSRLSGTALEFLRKAAEICKTQYDFSHFLSIIFKLTGKANRLLVTRATDTLILLGHYVGRKSLHKNIQLALTSSNKNTRYAAYKLVEARECDLGPCASQWIEMAKKDQAQEVRAIFKTAAKPRPANQVIQPPNIVKVEPKPITPRKHMKIENKQEEKIKKLELEINKIARYASTKTTTISFYEKLNKLKKDKPWSMPVTDELTPQRLDKYLEKFRTKPNTASLSRASATGPAPKQSAQSSIKSECEFEAGDARAHSSAIDTNTSNDNGISMADYTCNEPLSKKNIIIGNVRNHRETHDVLADNTVDNVSISLPDISDNVSCSNPDRMLSCADSSKAAYIIHETIPTDVMNHEIGTEDLFEDIPVFAGGDISNDSTYEKLDGSMGNNELANLSKSLINISIEPSFVKGNTTDQEILQANPAQTSVVYLESQAEYTKEVEDTVILDRDCRQTVVESPIKENNQNDPEKEASKHRILNKEMFDGGNTVELESERPIFDLGSG